jgi:hypothetical protein
VSFEEELLLHIVWVHDEIVFVTSVGTSLPLLVLNAVGPDAGDSGTY